LLIMTILDGNLGLRSGSIRVSETTGESPLIKLHQLQKEATKE